MPRASGCRVQRMEKVSSCIVSGGEENIVARLGQFLRITGHLLEEVGYLCELRDYNDGVDDHARPQEAEEGEEEMAMMQTSNSRRRTNERRRPSSSPGPQDDRTEHRPRREEELSQEEVAIMLACEADETWQALRNLRPEAKQEMLSAICILVQEILEDNGRVRRTFQKLGDEMRRRRP